MATYEQQYSANPHLKEGADYWHLGDYANAGECFSAGLKAAQANGDLLASGISSLYLGLINLGNAQFETAQRRLQESLHSFPTEVSSAFLAMALAGLGRTYDEWSDVAETQGAYLQSLQISVAKHTLPPLLLVLPGIALRLAKEVNQQTPTPHLKAIEQLSQAIALYTMAIQHAREGEPAALTWFEAVYGQQIGQIIYDLAPDIVPEAQSKGKQLDLWPTAVALEAELKKSGWKSQTPSYVNKQFKDPATSLSPPPLTIPAVEEERRKQLILLDKVQNAWVKGVLEPLKQSIQEAELISLRRLRLDTAVNTPWADIIETDKVHEPVPPDESTLEIFLKADRALLILGEPGSGKTTTLIQLARDLIALTRTHPNQPIPVVMNLSTWAEARGDLADWIVEELTAKYQMPRQLGREWLDKNQLLLLLDGLDEMPPDAQPKCIAAINNFRETYGLIGLVICCRRSDYQAHEIRLKLGGAILIQPLSRSQIETYLTEAGFRTAVLANLLEKDKALWELTESPLMLSMVRQAFSQDESDLSHLLKGAVANPQNDVSAHRRLFFAAFVDRMFKRRGATASFSPAETKKKLTWLAQRMVEHNQSIFLIEQLQPSWLPDRKWRWGYFIISRAILGVSVGILLWLTALFGQLAGLDLTGGLYSLVANQLQLSFNTAVFIFLTFLSLLLGVLIGIIDGFIYDRQIDFTSDGRRLYRLYLATIGLIVGLPAAIVFALFDQPLFALFLGMLTAAYFMNAINYSRQGINIREDIQTVEALSWSSRGAIRSLLLYGLLTTFIFGYLGWLLWGNFGIAFAPNFALFFFLIGGMRRSRLETSSKLNQGIRLSLRNSLFAALIYGVLSGSLFGLLFNPTTGLVAFAFMALAAWLLYGGTVILKHFGLRLMLWQNGRLPLKLKPFFNQARDLIFMRRVGGGYMFTHRLLQDYFASLVSGSQAIAAIPPSKTITVSEKTAAPKPTSQTQPVPPLSTFPERYIQEDLIGTGTMGKVYRGKDTLTGQIVAIKQLRAYLADEYPEAVKRFIREGEALQQLNHPNILSVLDVISDEDRYLIVTEYLPGSLRGLLFEQPQLPVQQTVAIGLELADALARAHHLNIIHRDVKPENILLAADGTPRLADFGVAHLGQHATRLTEEGGFMGTPLYLSPEICVGEPASPRSDIWSLGIVLYEMLAGRPPFKNQQVMATMLTIVNDPIPDLKQFRPDIPAALIFLLDDMLTKDPAQRLGRMRQVAAELERIQDDLQTPLK